MHTLKAAAQLAGVHPRTVRRWIKAGRIQASKIRGRHGPSWMLDREQLDALRTMAARDAAPVVEAPAAVGAPDLSVPWLSGDDGRIYGSESQAMGPQIGALLAAERDAGAAMERRATSAENEGLRVQVQALREQLDATRDALGRAETQAATAHVMLAQLRDQATQASEQLAWERAKVRSLRAQLDAGQAQAQGGRVTLPLAAAQLRAVASARG